MVDKRSLSAGIEPGSYLRFVRHGKRVCSVAVNEVPSCFKCQMSCVLWVMVGRCVSSMGPLLWKVKGHTPVLCNVEARMGMLLVCCTKGRG